MANKARKMRCNKSFGFSSCAITVLLLHVCISTSGAEMRPKTFVGKKIGNDVKRITEDTMNQNLKKMEYAVRGAVVIAADQINAELAKGTSNSPFDHIIYTNIGNPHSLGQQALTWPRQVIALSDLPDEAGVDHPKATELFPSDAVERARGIKKALSGHGTGAYTHSQGPALFRKQISEFIEDRDKLKRGIVNPDNIFMTNGASSGINMLLSTVIADDTCGVMIPIPQYPIYSATIEMLGGHKVGYFLDEGKGWDVNLEELERSLKEAQDAGINVNSFVLINPGNPTGQVLSKTSVQEIVQFCSKHNLVLFADEVYQENVYDEKAKFYSCNRAARDIGLIQKNAIELASFHSTSKGIFGECGRRGGYMELTGFDPKVKEQIYKLSSSTLCSNTGGQIMTSLMVNGPKPGDVSYENHEMEKKAIFDSLKKRAKIASDGFNAIEGIECQESQGAMYCFPKITIPPKAIDEAKSQGVSVDGMYAISLLKRTGICVVPASGFGQEPGRIGFRTTFLPAEDEMRKVVESVGTHHREFCEQYS